jgi:hypothetical protein
MTETKTPTEIHDETLKKLYGNFLKAKKMDEIAPKQLDMAEKRYHLFKDGSYHPNKPSHHATHQASQLNNKLTAINKKHDLAITKTPSEIHKETLKKLYDDLLAARTTVQTAPDTLNSAEKKYYTFKDGSYESRMMKRYTLQATELKTQMMQKYDQTMSETMNSLSYYNSQRTYSQNINMIKLTILKDILDKLEQLRDELANKNTNNRKSYYVIQDQESVVSWLHFFNQSLFAFAILIIIFSVREHDINKAVMAGIIVFLLFIIYGLETVVKVMRKIPTSFNIYTSWAYDNEPDHISIAWFIAAGAIVLYLLLKYTS